MNVILVLFIYNLSENDRKVHFIKAKPIPYNSNY